VVSRSECITGVTQTRWPARLEFFPGRPAWLLDSAHNRLAFLALSDFLSRSLPQGPRSLLLGASDSEKAVEALRILGPLFPAIYLAGGFFKAAEPHVIRGEFSALRRENLTCFADPDGAIHSLQERHAGEEHCIVVAGSIYLAGACRSILLRTSYTSSRWPLT